MRISDWSSDVCSSDLVDVARSSAELLKLKQAFATGAAQQAQEAPVRLTLPDGSLYPLPGRLKFSEVSVDPSSGSVVLRAVFPNPNGTLLPGMYVKEIGREHVGTPVTNAQIVGRRLHEKKKKESNRRYQTVQQDNSV